MLKTIVGSKCCDLGAYRRYKQCSGNRFSRLVFVCAGNICRSAYAENRALAMGITCTSFGLEAVGGDPASDMMVEAAAEQGIDLRSHRSRAFSQIEVREGDLFVAMEPEHGRRIRSLIGQRQEVTLLGLWAAPAQPHICDPYALGREYHATCVRLIDTAIRRLCEDVQLG
jgi:protein-tyrosine phosphatase